MSDANAFDFGKFIPGFDFLQKLSASARGAGGAGLGLSLCRKIARLHRGDVRIESKIGKGTRVCYRFDTSL